MFIKTIFCNTFYVSIYNVYTALLEAFFLYLTSICSVKSGQTPLNVTYPIPFLTTLAKKRGAAEEVNPDLICLDYKGGLGDIYINPILF